jgi:DNA mismatch repair protein MutL
VAGFAAALAEQGPVRGPQHVCVNRRLVKDRTIAHAIQQAYSVATIKERSPEVHLFLEVPPDRVDVNVHPTKAEVRFLDQGLVHEILRRALVDSLGQGSAPELVLRPGAPMPAQPGHTALPWSFEGSPTATIGQGAFTGRPEVEGALAHAIEQGIPAQWPAGPAGSAGAPDPRMGTQAGHASVAALIKPMVPLGQFRNTFIIAVDDDGVAIIDQHVAHERILFELIAERLTTGRVEIPDPV